MPRRAISTSVANRSGMSNRLPRARLIRTPRPSSPPVHSATIAPTTARVIPIRRPPTMPGRAAGISTSRIRCRRDDPVAPGHLEEAPVHPADGDHHADGDREEDHERDDDRAGEEPRAEPEGDERRQGQDRHGLGGDEIGRHQAVRQPGAGEEIAGRQRGGGPDREAHDDLTQRRDEVVPEDALEPRLDEALGDQGRARQDERRVAADPDDRLPGRPGSRRRRRSAG